jgi:hypothetical protein
VSVNQGVVVQITCPRRAAAADSLDIRGKIIDLIHFSRRGEAAVPKAKIEDLKFIGLRRLELRLPQVNTADPKTLIL